MDVGSAFFSSLLFSSPPESVLLPAAKQFATDPNPRKSPGCVVGGE
jgi:hypothetical protein